MLKNALIIILSFFWNLNLFAAEDKCTSLDTLDTLEVKVFYWADENPNEAINCAYILANDYNDRMGYSWLGYYYFEGIGLELNYEKAIENLHKASDLGDGWSSDFLNNIYSKGIYVDGVVYAEKDYVKAFEFSELAYEQNYIEASIDLADSYYFGLGTEINYTKSFQMLDRNLDSLESYGKWLLGTHYILGRGTPQNIEKGVEIFEELLESGWSYVETDLNRLFGTNYKDKENRKIKSIYFEIKERAKKDHLSYFGLDIQDKLGGLIDDQKYIQAADYAQDIIDDYLNSNYEMPYEVCFALSNLSFVVNRNDLFPENLKKKVNEYDELAYQNKCGGGAGFNLASNYVWPEDVAKTDYDKAYEICLSSIKNDIDDQCISMIAYFFQNGYVVSENYYNAYILYLWEIENFMISLEADTEWVKMRLEETESKLNYEEKENAKKIVDLINKDFSEIYKILYQSNLDNYEEKLVVEQSNEDNGQDLLVPVYQQEIIQNRSNLEKNSSTSVNDVNPPEIFVNEDINIEGLVANLEINIKDISKLEAVFIDDTPVIIDTDNTGVIFISQSVFIGDQDKEIKITAYDKWGLHSIKTVSLKKSTETFNINYGKFYALIIGNNNYDYLPKLNTAINDAEDFAALLKSKYQFTDVVLLKNATRKEILTELYRFKNELSFNDNFLVYYAGHGEIDRQLDEGYWQPIDALPDLPTEWISNSTITSVISTMKSKHVLIVADSCYSGLLSRGSNISNETYKTRELYLQRMNNKKSRWVLASGGNEPVADGGGNGHSIFSQSLLDLLESNQREITISEISNKITQQVVTNSDQTPEIAPIHKSGHDGGEFIFVPKI